MATRFREVSLYIQTHKTSDWPRGPEAEVERRSHSGAAGAGEVDGARRRDDAGREADLPQARLVTGDDGVCDGVVPIPVRVRVRRLPKYGKQHT